VAAADVGEAADVAENFTESVGPLPRHGEGADAAGTGAADGAQIRILGELVFLRHFGQEFAEEELRVGVAEGIVFETAVAAVFTALLGGRDNARIHEQADGDGHFLFRDEVVEHGRHAVLAVGADVAAAILEDHERSWLCWIVLLRHIDPVIAHGAGIDGAVGEGVLRDFAARHAFLREGVGAEFVFIRGPKPGGGRQNQQHDAGEAGKGMHGRIVCMQPCLSIPALSKGGPVRMIPGVRWQRSLAAIVLRRSHEVLHYHQSPAMVGLPPASGPETILC
jgi:hypothetical protein